MSFEDVPTPVPAHGQVRIRNHAAGLNFFDILQIQGKYQIKPPFPFTPGAEVSGVVEALGTDVAGAAGGDRVLAAPMAGAFAERTVTPASRVFPMPQGMDFPEAAAMPVVYHTSYFA